LKPLVAIKRLGYEVLLRLGQSTVDCLPRFHPFRVSQCDIEGSSENGQDLLDFSGFGSLPKILRNPVNPVYFHGFQ
jgi:hypothetical protein